MNLHLVISGNISKTLIDLQPHWDKYSFNKCRLTGTVNGRPIRIVSCHNIRRINAFKAQTYELSHSEEVEINAEHKKIVF